MDFLGMQKISGDKNTPAQKSIADVKWLNFVVEKKVAKSFWDSFFFSWSIG